MKVKYKSLEIYFKDTSFEHDVFELIRAFYPESEFSSIYESLPEEIQSLFTHKVPMVKIEEHISLGVRASTEMR